MQEVQEHVMLAPLTTFEIGGPAKYLVDVRSEREISEAIAWARSKSVPFTVLGGGSNILAPDEGVHALVIRLVGNLWGFAKGEADAWAGTNLLTLIRAAGAQGWGGWEKLAGIPGSLGGAVRGNAGAFGSEIKDFLVSVRALNSETGKLRDFSNHECDFSYRHSFFKDHPQWIIVRGKVKLCEQLSSECQRLCEETIQERERRHLQNVKAAGSYFMNPKAPPEIIAMFEQEKNARSREGRVPAGWLIEKAGMKGAQVGGAIASLQHPNYLVNENDSSAAEVRELAEQIKKAVQSQFGVSLQEEAAVWG